MKEQNVCIRFGFKLEKIIMETYEVLKIAYGEQTVERPLVLIGLPSPSDEDARGLGHLLTSKT